MQENVEADFKLEAGDMKFFEVLDIKARFNDPSVYYQWKLFGVLVAQVVLKHCTKQNTVT